jgi:hypothetical protein
MAGFLDLARTNANNLNLVPGGHSWQARRPKAARNLSRYSFSESGLSRCPGSGDTLFQEQSFYFDSDRPPINAVVTVLASHAIRAKAAIFRMFVSGFG